MSAAVPLRLAFAGGGTGGHVVPGLHLLEALETEAPGALRDLLWFGAGRAVEDRVLAGLGARAAGAELERVTLRLEPVGGGAPSLGGLARRLPGAVGAARRALRRHRTDVLVGLGGFTTVPAVLAARSIGIPVTLLEINAVPGRATRWLGRCARRVHHAWPATLPGGTQEQARAGVRHVHVGPPLGSSFTRAEAAEDTAAARAALGVAPERALLLVLGGSQGALGLNRFVAAQAATLCEAADVLHQVGPGRLAEAAPARVGYRAVEYLDDVALALRAATLVLCRGGASTLAEVGALRRPAWVVPYPHHRDRHQERNAAMLGEGVRVVLEEQLLRDGGEPEARALARRLGPDGAEERARRAAALADRVPRDAARAIVRDLLELAKART